MTITVGTDTYISIADADTFVAANYLTTEAKYIAWDALADAAKEIKDMVMAIQNETAKMKESSDVVGKVVVTTKDRVDVLIKLMRSFQKNAGRSVFEVESISNKIFINLAKLDHVIYKNNLYQLLFGENNDFKPTAHTNCRLGKWYDSGLGKKEFGSVKSYSQLNRPHAIVHD